MAAVAAMRCEHSPNGGIQWLRVKPWMCSVASSEALDVLHQSIHPGSYRCIRMAIKIASDLPAFFVIANSLLPTNIAK